MWHDKQFQTGKMKKEKSIIEFFVGAGTGIIVSCLLSPDSIRRTVVIIIGLVMIGIGWYKKTRYDNKVFRYNRRPIRMKMETSWETKKRMRTTSPSMVPVSLIWYEFLHKILVGHKTNRGTWVFWWENNKIYGEVKICFCIFWRKYFFSFKQRRPHLRPPPMTRIY